MDIAQRQPERLPGGSGPQAPDIPLKKRALLLGIQYEGIGEKETGVLRGSHRDVAEMKELLINYYEYLPADIVVLIDRDDPEQLQPTRANIIQEIHKLVKDARPGDHFFFHYAGHTEQTTSGLRYKGYEVGEHCLIPSDGENNAITGNELRQYLVDSLPIGSDLVAIFDCSSVLNLEHIHCNSVYVPWVLKRWRIRNADSRINSRVRWSGLDTAVQFTPRISTHSAPVIHIPPRLPDQNINANSVTSQRTPIGYPFYPSQNGWDYPAGSMSPCTGWCPPMNSHEANVICLAACRDDQRSWEDQDRASMSKVLINILKHDPHPVLIDLLVQASHELHNMFLRLHKHAGEYRTRVRELNPHRLATGLRPLRLTNEVPDMNNFKDPQMSSHRPLDRDAKWNP